MLETFFLIQVITITPYKHKIIVVSYKVVNLKTLNILIVFLVFIGVTMSQQMRTSLCPLCPMEGL